MEEIEVRSIAEFAEVAQQKTAIGQCWFRGIKDAAYDLLPTLYRHKGPGNYDGFVELERKLIQAFRHRSPPFVTQSLPDDDLELLFMMQHHGIPTRLLDWTENPFMALFFALEGVREMDRAPSDVGVWMLSPQALNKHSLASFGHDGILSVGDDLLRGYEPRKSDRHPPGNSPVAILGVHNSRRIVAQRGVFVLFGSKAEPVNKINFDEGANALTKLIIKADNARPLFKQLFGMGISDSVVFPDLDGLAREIKTQHGF